MEKDWWKHSVVYKCTHKVLKIAMQMVLVI